MSRHARRFMPLLPELPRTFQVDPARSRRTTGSLPYLEKKKKKARESMDRVETLTFFFPLSILSYSTFFVCTLSLFYISPSFYFFIISFFFLKDFVSVFLFFFFFFVFYLCREGSSRIRAKKQRQEEKGEEFVKREECNVWSYVILSAVRWPTMLSLFFSVRASWPPRILPKRF